MTLIAMRFLISYSLLYTQAYFFVFSKNFETT